MKLCLKYYWFVFFSDTVYIYISIRPTYSCARALTQNNQCLLRLACDLVSGLSGE